MKLTSLFLIAAIGFAVVSAEADAELEGKLAEALRELFSNDKLETKADEGLETREVIGRCQADTNNCNGNGVCRLSTISRHSSYVCVCDTGYTNDMSGSCVAQTKREMALLDMSLRDSKMRCEADTNKCNGYGECLEGRIGWKCVCKNDNTIYKIDASGSCVPVSEEKEVESLQSRTAEEEVESLQSRTAELIARLQNMLQREE